MPPYLIALSDAEKRVFVELGNVNNPKIAKHLARSLNLKGGNYNDKYISKICKSWAMVQRGVVNRPKVGFWKDDILAQRIKAN